MKWCSGIDWEGKRSVEGRREERPGDNERLVWGEEGSEMPGNYTPLPAPFPALDSFHFMPGVHCVRTNMCLHVTELSPCVI